MKTIKLKTPIDFAGEAISIITLREPKAKDLRLFPADPNTGDLLDLAGRLSAQPKQVIDELSMADMQAILKAVADFLVVGDETGSDS